MGELAFVIIFLILGLIYILEIRYSIALKYGWALISSIIAMILMNLAFILIECFKEWKKGFYFIKITYNQYFYKDKNGNHRQVMQSNLNNIK